MRKCSQVSIMEFLTFDLSEYRVLEDIEFDEAVQRDEKVRFYTVDEQVVDAFEKMIPSGKVTKYQFQEVQKQVDRIRDLYQTYVIPTAETYELREPEFAQRFSWVKPIYATSDRKAYDFSSQWAPLYENTRVAGFYPRMIAALPQPFSEVGEGTPYTFNETTEFVNSEGGDAMRALPSFEMVRTQHHEDKTISILRVPVAGTADSVSISGYHIDKRSVDIPNPLAEHPFLKSNEPGVVETSAPLKDVAPSLDAIMQHGIPVTQDPYTEGLQYLSVYDIRLADIPWSSWRSRFPPADQATGILPEVEISFPKAQQLAPPDKLVTAYKSEFSPGVSVRKWLMDREDGGEFVPQLLLSDAINNGSIESVPGVDIASAEYPETTMEECSLLGSTFQDFVIKGNLRRTWTIEKNKDVIKIQCVPLEFVKQERARVGYIGRKPWLESTGSDIIETYSRKLEYSRPIKDLPTKKVASEPKTPARPDSLQRKEVQLILEDTRRFAEDKVRDVQEILKETMLNVNIYSDFEDNFVMCAHTLAMLSGDFAKDRRVFFDKWTAAVDGSRVCKFCGEEVSQLDLVDQDDFDESGMVLRHTGTLEEQLFHGESIVSFITGLRAIQPLFLLDNAHDATVYLILSLLEVLPEAFQLEPLLKIGRQRAKVQFEKGKPDQIAEFSGMLGIATTVLILQTHVPSLTPRRAFGPRPLKLDGYPRDLSEPEDYTIVDSLMMIMRKKFEAFPMSFKGPSQKVIRAILNKKGVVKKTVETLLSAKSPLMKDGDIPKRMEDAKIYWKNAPHIEQPKTLITLPPAEPKEFGTIIKFTPCPSNRPIYASDRPPQVVQTTFPMLTGIQAAKSMEEMEPTVSVRETVEVVAKPSIQTMLKKKAAGPIAMKDPYRTNVSIASFLSDTFHIPIPLRKIDPTQKKDELRDIAQGYVYEMLATIKSDPIKRAKLEQLRTSNVTLYTLLADFKEEKTNMNKLRAQERLRFVEEMARKSDQEREILRDLLAIGLAPYIITNRDREAFAQQAQQLQDQLRVQEEDFEVDQEAEVGVGMAQDYQDQGDEPVGGTDRGDYGDYVANPSNDGRDYQQTGFGDDEATGI